MDDFVLFDPIIVKVAKCEKLNCRELPKPTAKVVCVLNRDEDLMVDSWNPMWAHVYTEAGIEGYVMRTYIKEE